MSSEVEKKFDEQYEPGKIVLSRYKIIKQVNKGGMGSKIFLAEDISHGDMKTGSFSNMQTKYLAIKVVYRQESQTDDE
jgi:serine/threonine protein kinase